MDQIIKEPLLEKIKNRFEKLNNVHYADYDLELRLFFNFLEHNEITNDLLLNLKNSSKEFQDYLHHTNPFIFKPQKEFEKYFQSFAIIQKTLELNVAYPQWRIMEQLDNHAKPHGTDKATMYFNEKFVGSIVEYLLESIVDQNIILSLLKKYKQRSEWFRKKLLYDLYESNTKVAERLLSFDLYEYLFDHGVSFFIEPSSSSGRIDLISLQHYENPLLAEIKIFSPEKSKNLSYLANGINQIYTYTQNFNQSFGYLIIYNTSKSDLGLSLSNVHKGIPYFHYNNKVIYVLVIDINTQVKTASKKGKIKYYDFTEDFIANKIIE